MFILTDGGVENTSSCISLCHLRQDSTRVHAFGIGSGASKELVLGVSLLGRGISAFIEDDGAGKIEEEVIKAMSEVCKPHYTVKCIDEDV